MRLLLDTHVLIWWLTEPHKLSPPASAAILDEENQVFVSAASLWEIATKARIGKLPQMVDHVPGLIALIEDAALVLLPVDANHGLRAGSYAVPHGDPFDRMLAAQAELGDLTLITTDGAFAAFPCGTMW